ncbi:hypothetical protein [Ktedonobacter robiniae]|uniref:Uncharacterized protein n=1 Tax=Ktedonobacter robiniae TaxID=2778365 RepID=A0ABQ3UZM0_9CHLR|nr:hypothetical protein [Ktedonobacter robiniae]GHO58118.1 hypothetical protein KSB_65930 [Ktedonobacter robiniae]
MRANLNRISCSTSATSFSSRLDQPSALVRWPVQTQMITWSAIVMPDSQHTRSREESEQEKMEKSMRLVEILAS